jgi:hypothetical protein
LFASQAHVGTRALAIHVHDLMYVTIPGPRRGSRSWPDEDRRDSAVGLAKAAPERRWNAAMLRNFAARSRFDAAGAALPDAPPENTDARITKA